MAQLPKWRAAKARVISGQGQARIVCIGDSTTYGFGAGPSSGTGTTGYKYNYPYQLAVLLSSLGIPAHNNSWFGDSKGSAIRDAIDGRIVRGGAWADFGSTTATMGGSIYTTSSAGTFTYTPDRAVDSVKTWYAVHSSGGTLDFQLGSGTSTPVSTSGATAMASRTDTNTLGSQAMTVAWSSGSAAASLCGMEAWNSTTSSVAIMNAGWYGCLAGDFNQANAAPWSMPQVLTAVGADLTIIDLCINDMNQGTNLTTYQTNVQAAITAALSVGDVIIKTPAPSNPAIDASVSTQQSYVNVLYTLAASNGVTLIDGWQRWQPYATQNTNGLCYDDKHPNPLGYADIASMMAQVLVNAQ